ncbi:hypothetical protein PF010_g30872 [Phytophthora fragariae]|uniref:Reverse transcriptase Ty1/copia-type domain-containing protein n=1 Tax=Phytophthora fragariae TaxID=53985 RepID=A0A6G0JJG9_9STRA|nr:hypothetical protein PF010_g30872 [Phytophthora fragariae]
MVAKGYSQRHGIDYEETYSLVAYLNSVRAMLARCGAEGMEIEQCDVDTAFLYGKLEEEIYMELPEGLRELLELAEAEGEDDVVCMLLQSLFGLKQASRVWSETIDKHLKSMGFEPADADPCVYTRGEGDDECIVCLYVGDMLIASRQKAVIVSVKAGITEKFRTKDLGSARVILGSDCVKECVWMRRLLKDIGAEQVGATVIYEDNQGAMALAKNVGYQARTKHIDIRYHFIREKVVSNEVELEYVDTKNQLADFMTKGLSSKTLRYLMMRSNVGPKLETSN